MKSPSGAPVIKASYLAVAVTVATLIVCFLGIRAELNGPKTASVADAADLRPDEFHQY